ncbi:hypothetical protein KJ865_13820 [Myxococcota bacterium]|nr:hypothetical protein [Myxococcota bacterium]
MITEEKITKTTKQILNLAKKGEFAEDAVAAAIYELVEADKHVTYTMCEIDGQGNYFQEDLKAKTVGSAKREARRKAGYQSKVTIYANKQPIAWIITNWGRYFGTEGETWLKPHTVPNDYIVEMREF